MALADEIENGQTGFLIERALDEARSRQFQADWLKSRMSAFGAKRTSRRAQGLDRLGRE
jgi:hypothetical protein